MGGLSRYVAPAITAAVLITGCAGEPSGAAVLPARDTSPVTAPSAVQTTEQIAAQAVAVVRAYFAEINRAITTGETESLRAMQADGCICRELTENIRQRWQIGRVESRGLFAVRGLRAFDVHPDVASVEASLDALAYVEVPRQGKRRTVPAVPGVVQEVEVVRRGSAWVVSHVRSLSAPSR